MAAPVCPNCGTSLAGLTARFCPRCGRPLGPADPIPPQPQYAPGMALPPAPQLSPPAAVRPGPYHAADPVAPPASTPSLSPAQAALNTRLSTAIFLIAVAMVAASAFIVAADVVYQLTHFDQSPVDFPTWVSATPPIASFLALAALFLHWLAERLRKRDQDRLAAIYGLSGTLVALSDLPAWMRWVWPKPQHLTAGAMRKVRATSTLGRLFSFGLTAVVLVSSVGVTIAAPHHFFLPVGEGGTPSAIVQPTSTLAPTATATSSTANCAAPPLDPSANQIISAVAHTTGMVNWQNGKLAPENNLATFTISQAFVTAAKMTTKSAGTLGIRDAFCNDGHSPAADSFTTNVPANSGGSWVVQSLWIYDTSRPTDIGQFLETLTWNGVVISNTYLTVKSTSVSYLCPSVQAGSASDFTVSNLTVTASQISESQTSYLHFQYRATKSGALSFFYCVDGTTLQSGHTQTIGTGSNTWQQYQQMIQVEAGCSTCQWYGNARWYVVWNNQVIGQVPFAVTQ